MLPRFRPEAQVPPHSRRQACCMINPRELLMSLPRGVGSTGSLGEPLSWYLAGVCLEVSL